MEGYEQDKWFVIITGMSGAGKTQAANFLEDLGFYCVDNLPPNLLGTFGDLAQQHSEKLGRTALVVDIRGGELFDHFFGALGELQERGIPYHIVFLEASDDVLVRRFKESRRPHPLAENGLLLEGIREERRRLEDLREVAHHLIDTSQLSPRGLKERLWQIFGFSENLGRLRVTVVSFGYKFGLPLDADLVFDVRFLPNPFYDPELRPLSGKDTKVRDSVMNSRVAQDFLRRIASLVLDYMPHYEREGKRGLFVALGCTGGRHRSVALASEFSRLLQEHLVPVQVKHRDIDRGESGL